MPDTPGNWTLSRTTGLVALLVAMLNEKRVLTDADVAELFDKSEVPVDEIRRLVNAS